MVLIMSFSYQGYKGSGVSPTFLQTNTWSEDSVSAGNPERSDNARQHWSHISVEPFRTWRRFGPLAVAHTRLMKEVRRVTSSTGEQLTRDDAAAENSHTRELKTWMRSSKCLSFTHRCLSCRCTRGGSCRVRRSSVRRRATPSPHSLHQRENSCLAALCTSSHTTETPWQFAFKEIIICSKWVCE